MYLCNNSVSVSALCDAIFLLFKCLCIVKKMYTLIGKGWTELYAGHKIHINACQLLL